ncbi:MAG: hypothetical protein K0S72_720 [Arthrobacter sp.]|nr:hypothetical protein [Arthrobacter sp.]
MEHWTAMEHLDTAKAADRGSAAFAVTAEDYRNELTLGEPTSGGAARPGCTALQGAPFVFTHASPDPGILA